MRLATITAAALLVSALLLWFTLWVSETVAKATMPRTEITLNEIQP